MTTEATARTQSRQQHDPFGWRQEGQDLLRGLAGGAIVGMPLLFTMEMWWHGMALSEWHLLALLGAILAINTLFSYFVGLREEHTLAGAVCDAVTACGVAVLLSTVVLWLIGELTGDLGAVERAGKVLIEATGVSLGVSFANAYRGKSRTGGEETENEASEPPAETEDRERMQLHADLNDLGATLAGATVFALNIAPTEEVLQIAARLGPWQQLALLAAAFLLSYAILFGAQFEETSVHVESVFQHPIAETVMACAVSFLVAFALLALVGQREVLSHPATEVAAVITLGLPAAIGGAAGRLIV